MTEPEKCIHCGIVATGYRYYCEETGRYECADCVVAERDRLKARLERVREPVRWFAEQMEAKLKENDHKRHWRKAEMGYLRRRLADELGELRRRLDGRYKKDITDKDWARECIREAADVANFAMMIADNVRAILDTPAKEGE